jgi:alpha-tubulin suppressor-like RCC1 family protein
MGSIRMPAVRHLWLLPGAVMTLFAAMPQAGYAASGGAVSWGENSHGQLGTIYKSQREEAPVAVEGLNNVTAIADAASFNLALLSNGTVESWGGNIYGQLGNGGHKANWELGKSHVAVAELSGVRSIAAANEHALALLENGTVKAWGNNMYGQLGNGVGGIGTTSESQRVPQTVHGLTNVIGIASGGGSNYALLANHTVMAWGNNTKGQLGIGKLGPSYCETETGKGERAEACSTTPLQVVTAKGKPLERVAAVYAGDAAGYAVLENGRVMSWGSNLKGQLGQLGVEAGFHAKNIPPGEVMRSNREALSGVVAIAAGANHALALLKTGQVPTPVTGLERVSAISAGGTHALALLDAGAAPPAPLISVTPGSKALNLSWTVNGADRVMWRAFERSEPASEFEEGARKEEESPNEPRATSEAEAAKEAEIAEEAEAAVEQEEVKATESPKRAPQTDKGNARAGRSKGQAEAKGSEGKPSAAGKAGEAMGPEGKASPTAKASGAKGTEANASAPPQTGEAKGAEVSTAEATEGSEEAKGPTEAGSTVHGRAKLEHIRLSGNEYSAVSSGLYGVPLQAIPYEVKIETDKGEIERKTRTFVAIPLP